MKMNYNIVMGLVSLITLLFIFVSLMPLVNSDSLVINTFMNYEDSPSSTSKTVTQGDSFNVVLVAYGHGEALEYEKLELVSSTLIFKEYVAGDKILDYTWLYSKTYTLNTGILNPGTYTLRFTARTKITQSEEYSDLQLTILPKIIPPVCGNNVKEGTEQCDNGVLNGNVCNPLYGSSCTYCSTACKLVTVTGPRCGDGSCSAINGETCSTCPTDCGVCPDNIKPVVDITNPIATTYTSHRTSLTFSVYDDNLQSCTYKLNSNVAVNIPSVVNGVRTITGITSVVGTNTWTVTCRDVTGNTGTDSVTFTVTIPPVCGNNVKEGTEQCDNGVLNGNVCNPLYGSSCTYCSTACKLVTVTGPKCGDGLCSAVNGETCSTCPTDCGVCPPVCGNNVKEGIEQCDNGVLNGNVCNPLYGSSCTYCSTACKLVTVTGPRCGDGSCSAINGETCSTCPTDCGACAVCDLTNAHWSVSSAFTGTVVSLIVQGTNCNGKTIDFAVYQDKLLGDVYVTNTATAVFSTSNSVSSAWVTIAPLNGDTTPTYYFIAKVIGSSESATSGYLDVIIPPKCGDGICNGDETCSTCPTDCGVCPAVCGNNVKEGTEQCDSGTLNGNVCNPLYGSSCTYCSTACKLVTLNGPYCGDGVKQSNEQCDDGNKVSGDGCSAICQTEIVKECTLQIIKSTDKSNVKPGDVVAFTLRYKNIGNGDCTGGGVKIQDILNSNLKYMGSYTKTLTGDSDGQSLSFGWQTTPGYVESTNTLTWNAHVVSPGEEGIIKFNVKVLEPAQCGDFNINNYFKIWSNEKGWQTSNTITLYVDDECYSPVCGNNILDTGEQCDKGILNGNVCNPLYGSSCTYCSTACKLVTLNGPHCGDGTCNGAENCTTCSEDCGVCPPTCGDGTCNNGETCSTCPVDCGVCPPVCGNNVKEGTEQCDNGVLNGNVCNPLYGSSCTYCSTACKLIIVNGSSCGDGTCNGAETCTTCSQDCGVCPKNCTVCKDSKPLDDSDYDYYYLQSLNKKPTVISEDTTPTTSDLDKKGNLLLENKFPLIALIFIIGILVLLILVVIIRLIRR